ncbi:MAG: hypothetical protein AMXMBFR53_23940 [Gemmatimonadota bacterium]
MPREEINQVVGRAIQDLAAVRLGRGFVPLALLFLLGLGQMLARSGGFVLAAGAPLSAGAMLAYGMRVVQRAFGRGGRPWMAAAAAAGLVPPAFGVYVLGWEGLRGVAQASGFASGAAGLLLAVLGTWVLRAWMQILELRRLADTMALGALDAGDEAE